MNPKIINNRNELSQQIKCIAIFLAINIIPILSAVHFAGTRSIFHIILFFDGWFTWTFAEYIMHRFWNHSKSANKQNPIIQRHHHHHTHPTDIKVSGRQRIQMILIGFVLILVSAWADNIITFFAGLWVGMSWFFMVHFILHQRWVRKVFPGLLEFHIVHHCKEPGRCFGISVTWWDLIFKTGPSRRKMISEKVIAFYFNGHA
jgi:dihydroceramide fatty acyl 2-hydroxylase